MNRQFEQVKEFHTSCGIEMPDKPKMLEGGEYKHWNCVYSSDLDVLCISMKVDTPRDPLNHVLPRASYMLEELIEFMKAKTLEDQADALIDLIYFAIGTFTLMGVKPSEIFEIVHRANMGKVGIDGKVTRNAQGKIQKPDGWHEKFAPEKLIALEIECQRRD